MQLKKRNIWIASLLLLLTLVAGARLFSSQLKPLEAKDKIQPRATYNGDQYVTNSEIKTTKGKPIVNGDTMYLQTQYELRYDWELPDNTFKEGDVIVFSIPDEFNILSNQTFPVVDNNGNLMGNAEIVKGANGYEIQMTMTHHIESHSNVKGNFTLIFALDQTYVNDGDNTIKIPGGDITVNIPNGNGGGGGGGGGQGAGDPKYNFKEGEVEVAEGAPGGRTINYKVSLGRETLLGKADSFEDIESITIADEPINQVIYPDTFGKNVVMRETGFFDELNFVYPYMEIGDPRLTLANDMRSFEVEILPTVKEFEQLAQEKETKFRSYDLRYATLPIDPSLNQEVTNNAKIKIKYKPEAEIDDREWVLSDEVAWNAGGGSVTGENGWVRLIKHDANGNATDEQYRLSGAEFDLYKKSDSGGQDTKINKIDLVTDKDGVIEYKGLTTGKYYFKETQAPAGYEVSPAEYPFEITKDNMDAFIEVAVPDNPIETEKDYSLELQKTDDEGKALTGAEFQLKAADGSMDQKTTVDGNGKVKFSPLVPEVTYELTETKAPDGYIKKEETYTIVMDNDGKLTVKEGAKTLVEGQDYTWDEKNLVLSFSVENTKTTKEIILTKTDKETGEPLQGAVFIIQPLVLSSSVFEWDSQYVLQGEAGKRFVTDENGQIIINDKTYPGLIDQLIDDRGKTVDGRKIFQYRFREIEAPPGYPDPKFNSDKRFEEQTEGTAFSIDIEVHKFESDNVTKLDYSLTNSKKELLGNVELVKFDIQNTNQTLSGAKFDLYREGESTPYQTGLETNAQGKLLVSNLPLGDYYFVETKAPDGYVLPEGEANRFEFSITEENNSANVPVKVSAPNIKENVPTGSVKLYKYDSKNENISLKGAEFSLYKKDGTLLRAELTTDEDGILLVPDLPFGEYYFVETKAPDGYFINDSQYPFEITEDHVEVPVEVRVSNVKTPPRELTLTKTDEETGEPIPGVVFIIQNKNTFFEEWGPVDTGTNKQPLVTDQNGQIIINDTTYPGLIDHMIELNDRPDVNGMRFREISTPEGWVDPYPTKNGQKDSANDLSANDFAKDIPMDTLKGSPLSGDSIHVELTMTNRKGGVENKSITLKKIDADTGKAIPGVEFTVQALREDGKWDSDYSLDGERERKFVTDSNGLIIIDEETYPGMLDEMIQDVIGNADVEALRFRETKAPSGYADPQFVSGKEDKGNPGNQFSVKLDIEDLADGSVANLQVELKNKKAEDRTVTLKKEDDYTDKALSGAVFEVEKFDASSGTFKPTSIGKKTTGNDGTIQLTEQEINSLGSDYPIKIVFKEVTPPSGYDMPENPYSETITITADGATPDYVVKENHATPKDRKLTLKKVDGFSNMPLGEAGFQLYKEDENGDYNLYEELPKIFYTESNGEYIFDEYYEIRFMENGNYKLKEVEAPEGYELPDDPFTDKFTVSDTGVTPDRLVKKNYKENDFMLKKVDQNGKPVKGAKFDLYKYPGPGATGTPEDYGHPTYVTDENGEIIIDKDNLKEMEDGVYFWREIEAPEGYEILEQDTQTFTILNGKPNPPVIRHVNQYDGRLLEFYKHDDRGNYTEGLSGAVFELEKEVSPNNWQVVKDKDGKDINFTTEPTYNDDGEVYFAGTIFLGDHEIEKYGLTNGTYRFKEIEAPKGYELPEDPYTDKFVISETAIRPEAIYKKNSRLDDREITLKKVDGRDQNLGLAGAEFEFEWTWGEVVGEKDHEWHTYEKRNPATQKNEPVIFTTDENGEIKLTEDQIYEIYRIGDGANRKGRFKEVKAPEGYLMPDDVYSDIFMVEATEIVDLNGRPITEIKKVNYKPIDNYELELLKVNDNEARLNGAEFTLVPSDSSLETQVSTGELGVFNFKDLEPDVTYTLTETKAPDDYFINKTPYTFILRTDEDPDGILEVYYNGKLLEEGKDYEWNNTQLQLSLVIMNRKSSMPITGSIGILGLLIAGATTIGLAYNFQLKKKKSM